MIATIFLARPPLGSLVVRLITGDPIGISGVTYLCVAIHRWYYVMASGFRISPLQRVPNHLARSTEFHNEENTALLGHSHHNDRCGAMASIEIIPMFVTSEYDESMM